MTRRALPTDDDSEIERIEIDFAIPVYLRDTDYRDIGELLDRIIERPANQLADGVHWLASQGGKPKWSRTDCMMLRKAPDSDAPDSGEPTFDMSVYYVESCAREYTSDEERKNVEARYVEPPKKWRIAIELRQAMAALERARELAVRRGNWPDTMAAFERAMIATRLLLEELQGRRPEPVKLN